jgi:hypothetical protein
MACMMLLNICRCHLVLGALEVDAYTGVLALCAFLAHAVKLVSLRRRHRCPMCWHSHLVLIRLLQHLHDSHVFETCDLIIYRVSG